MSSSALLRTGKLGCVDRAKHAAQLTGAPPVSNRYEKGTQGALDILH